MVFPQIFLAVYILAHLGYPVNSVLTRNSCILSYISLFRETGCILN